MKKKSQKLLTLLLIVSLVAGALPAMLSAGLKAQSATGPVVTNTMDDAGTPGSLRWAIAAAAANDTITFAVSGGPVSITLGSALRVEESLTIDASGQGAAVELKLAGAGYRHIVAATGAALTLKGLTLTGTSGSSGGGVDAPGSLTAENCTVSQCTSSGFGGGGVFASGDVTLNGCTFTGNAASAPSGGNDGGYGGGLYVNGRLTAQGCQFTGNEAASGGGVSAGAASFSGCSFVGNTAGYGGAAFTEDGDIVATNSSFIKNTTALAQSGAVDAGGNSYLFQCTVAENMGAGSGLHIFKNRAAWLLNCLLGSNAGGQTGKYGDGSSCTLHAGSSLIAGAGEDYFGSTPVTSGYLMPLRTSAITGAARLTAMPEGIGLVAAVQQGILTALADDQTGRARDGAQVTFGAVELPADGSALNAAIAQAGTFAAGDYTSESWAALQTALAAAQQTAGDAATQTQVNAAAAALTNAISGLVPVTTPPAYLTGIRPGTTAAQLAQTLKANGTVPRDAALIWQSAGGAPLADADPVGTGTTVAANGRCFTVIMTGDLNGDGSVNSPDLLILKRVILGLQQLSGSFSLAANIDRDAAGGINATDLLLLKRALLGLQDIFGAA